jgi:hypothetical protein
MFARFVPAAEIHERDALRVMILGGFGRSNRKPRDALFANADVNLGAITEFPAGAFQGSLQGLFGALKLLLLKVLKRLFVEFELNQFGGGVRVRGHHFRLGTRLQALCFQHLLAASRRTRSAGYTMLHVVAPITVEET